MDGIGAREAWVGSGNDNKARGTGLPARPRGEIERFVVEGARLLLARAVAPRLGLLEPALAAWWVHLAATLSSDTPITKFN